MSDDEVATDPRLIAADPVIQPDPVVVVEAPEPEPAPEPEAPVGAETPPEPEPETKPAKTKKPVEEILKSRVGHMTKQLADKDALLADAARRLEAAEALMNGTGPTPADPTQQRQAPNGERLYTQAELAQGAAQIAAQQSFDKQADDTFKAGVAKHGDTFKEAVDNLNAVGVMTNPFLEAAFATDAAPEVINALGADPEEAARIAGLPPIRMAAEMAKLAAKLTAPKAAARVSAAPAPMTPVVGAVQPEIDLGRLAEDNEDVGSYAAARAKQGSPWATPMHRRRG